MHIKYSRTACTHERWLYWWFTDEEFAKAQNFEARSYVYLPPHWIPRPEEQEAGLAHERHWKKASWINK